MKWDDDRTAPMARSLSAEDRRVLEKAIRQADSAARSRQRDALEHGRWINVRPDPIDFRDEMYQPRLIALAPRLDPPAELAHIPVRDQGYLSSCTGMALATAVDVLRRRQWVLGGSQDEPPPVSARMLYEMGRAFDEHPDDGLRGSSVRGALRGFFHNGVCREIEAEDDPHRVGPNDWEFTIKRAEDARHVTLGLYARLRHVLLDYHCALNEVGVVVVSTKLHDGWRLGATLDSDEAEKRWRIRWDGSQTTLGGHAVVIVGYDEEGFLIRNSWGEGWSRWRDTYAGVAHWSYDDWQNNVMDGWVAHLSVASSHGARAIGGRFTDPGTAPAPSRGSPPRLVVNGHYLYVKDGRLVTSGTYNCSQRSIAATAELLRTTKKYDHLLIAVESGLDSLDTMVERARVLVPYLKKARIYPLFVWWREGCFEIASELLEDRARRLELRSGGVKELTTYMLETFAREFMQPFWRTFEGEAERSFTLADRKRGEAWVALRTLLAAARNHEPPLRVHAVAHSAGAVWLGELCHRLVDDGTKSRDWPGPAALDGLFQTVSLLAPICPPELFSQPKVLRLWSGDRQPRLAIYTLRKEDEQDDCVGAFQGSFLHLAQRAFPIGGDVPEGTGGSGSKVLGHASVARGVGQRRRDARWFSIGGAVRSTCRTHTDLARDVDVLEHVLRRVLEESGTAPPPLLASLP
jgi:hypothetical protein